MRRNDWMLVAAVLAFSVTWEAGVIWYLAPPAYAAGGDGGGGQRGGGGFNVGGGGDCRSCPVDHNPQVVDGFNNISPSDKGGGNGGDGPNIGAVGPGGTIGGGV